MNGGPPSRDVELKCLDPQSGNSYPQSAGASKKAQGDTTRQETVAESVEQAAAATVMALFPGDRGRYSCLLPPGVCKNETCKKTPGQPFVSSQDRDVHMDASFPERYACSLCGIKSRVKDTITKHIAGVKYCGFNGGRAVCVEDEKHWRKSLGILVLPDYKDDPLYDAVKKATPIVPV